MLYVPKIAIPKLCTNYNTIWYVTRDTYCTMYIHYAIDIFNFWFFERKNIAYYQITDEGVPNDPLYSHTPVSGKQMAIFLWTNKIFHNEQTFSWTMNNVVVQKHLQMKNELNRSFKEIKKRTKSLTIVCILWIPFLNTF